MQPAVGRQSFDGGDIGAVLHDCQRQARDNPPPVDQHGAGAELAVVTAFFCTGEVEIFAQRVKQSGPGTNRQRPLDAMTRSVTVCLGGNAGAGCI
jgi:hypothetical protein